MKATKLVELLQKKVEEYGENVDVFVSVSGFNDHIDCSLKDNVGDGVGVSDVTLYDKNLIKEYWCQNGEVTGKGSGFISGVVLYTGNHVYNEDEIDFD